MRNHLLKMVMKGWIGNWFITLFNWESGIEILGNEIWERKGIGNVKPARQYWEFLYFPHVDWGIWIISVLGIRTHTSCRTLILFHPTWSLSSLFYTTVHSILIHYLYCPTALPDAYWYEFYICLLIVSSWKKLILHMQTFLAGIFVQSFDIKCQSSVESWMTLIDNILTLLLNQEIPNIIISYGHMRHVWVTLWLFFIFLLFLILYVVTSSWENILMRAAFPFFSSSHISTSKTFFS